MKINDLVNQYVAEINQELNNIYPNGPMSLTEPINYVFKGGGKRLRPLLTLFSSEACGGSKEDALSSALAVEILHNFTLVHDDIMDHDSIRHGQKTVHKMWDEGIAILVGDAMLSISLKLLNNSSKTSSIKMTKFFDGLLSVCEGQALDKEFESKQNVNYEEYVEMIDLKTGHMIGLAAELGALCAGVDQEIYESIRDYGRLVGRAFQIQDDYLEIFSDSNSMGKSLESDIVLNKKTFLMIKAYSKNNNKINSAINLAKTDFSKGILEIRKYLTIEGIKEETLYEINEILFEADKIISRLSIDQSKLLYFSELIRNRGN